MMSKLVFSEDELMQSLEYAQPQIEGGQRLHGGFDEDGVYMCPRMKNRGPAFSAWTAALESRGGQPMAADSTLLAGVRFPSFGQQKLLLLENLGQSFWNSLTITGHIEARGRILAELTFPAFQDVVVEDISEMALGHLGKGLLKAHGIDEGGEPENGIGGHDIMWFALRDLAFGETDYPEPEVPENIARPEEDQKAMPPISQPHASTIYFLLNLLLIEFRAERGFASTEQILRDPDLFTDRREEAEHAAQIVDRIRLDEEVHVSSLRLYLGEIRSLTFKTTDGGTISGSEIVDPFWAAISKWATTEQPKLAAEQQRKILEERIRGASGRGPSPRRIQCPRREALGVDTPSERISIKAVSAARAPSGCDRRGPAHQGRGSRRRPLPPCAGLPRIRGRCRPLVQQTLHRLFERCREEPLDRRPGFVKIKCSRCRRPRAR